MRGKDALSINIPANFRITPAYAGKRHTAVISSGRYGDHPRVCGEKHVANFDDETGTGSPPRMRRKVCPPPLWLLCPGITPAYAGKRDRERGRHRQQEDHPRVCGEKVLTPARPVLKWGSPPRMRGKGIQQCYARVTVGITPAYAGKRRRLPSRPRPR